MEQIQITDFRNRVGFSVGTGRCGTKFIAKIVALETNVASSHERNPLNEAFHRYCKWYKLPVDNEGFLLTKQHEIEQDLKHKYFSFESSAHLSFSIKELFERFQARFILLVRRPDKVVNSYLHKGWYNREYVTSNPDLAPGYQGYKFHHFLGRIAPQGNEFYQWNRLSRVGKLAWYWNALNSRVLEQFDKIPESHYRIVKLEELTYEKYLELSEFMGYESSIGSETYQEIAQRRPNAYLNPPSFTDWSSAEVAEFESHVAPAAEKLDYPYKIESLIPEKRLAIQQDRGKYLNNTVKPVVRSSIVKARNLTNKIFNKLEKIFR